MNWQKNDRESYPYPKLAVLNKKNNIEDFVYEDIKLIDIKLIQMI